MILIANILLSQVVCVASTPLVQALPSGVPLPAATIPPGATPANQAAVTTSSAAPTPTPSAEPEEDDEDCDDDEEEDEEDLPFCDEL